MDAEWELGLCRRNVQPIRARARRNREVAEMCDWGNLMGEGWACDDAPHIGYGTAGAV